MLVPKGYPTPFFRITTRFWTTFWRGVEPLFGPDFRETRENPHVLHVQIDPKKCKKRPLFWPKKWSFFSDFCMRNLHILGGLAAKWVILDHPKITVFELFWGPSGHPNHRISLPKWGLEVTQKVVQKWVILGVPRNHPNTLKSGYLGR